MFLALALALSSTGSAASPGAVSAARDIATAGHDRPPEMVVSCGPVSAVYDQLGSLPMAVGMAVGMRAQALGLPLDAAGATAAGIDLDGFLRAAVWAGEGEGARDPLVLELPFSGDHAAARALVEGLQGVEVQPDGDGWVLGTRKEVFEVAHQPGSLTLTAGHPLPPAADGAPAPMTDGILDGLAELDGCVLALGAPPKLPRRTEVPPMRAAAMVLPLQSDAPLVVRLATQQAAPAAFGAPGGAAVGGSSTLQPIAVLSLGLGVWDFLDGLPPELLPPDLDLARSRQWIEMGPGATLAVFQGDDEPHVVVSLPVLEPKSGKPRRARKTVRQLVRSMKGEDGIDVTRTSRTSFEVRIQPDLDELNPRVARMMAQRDMDQGIVIFGQARDGLLSFGDALALVEENAEGLGTTWLSAQDRAWTSDYAVALVVHAPEGPRGAMHGQLGLRAVDDMWEVQVALPGDDGSGIMARFVELALPRMMQLQQTFDGAQQQLEDEVGGAPPMAPPAGD